MIEEWKEVVGYEGLYQVSNLGRLKYLEKNGHRCGIMKPSVKKDGYVRVMLCKNGTYKTLYVHRLVASAFLLRHDEETEVNHIDGNKANNQVTNLEWSTRSQNQKHAIQLGLRKPSPMTGKKGKSNPKAKAVDQFDLDGNFIKSWECISDAARELGCLPSSIIACASKNIRTKTCKNYIWRYK